MKILKTGNNLYRLILIHVIGTALWIFLIFSNCQAQIPQLKVGIYHFPPFLVVQNRETNGTELRRLETVLKNTGINYIVDGYSVKRLYNNFDRGKVDLILASKAIAENNANIIVSQKSIAVLDLRIYSLPDTMLSRNRHTWSGKNICIIRGFKYDSLINLFNDMEKQNHVKINRANDHLSAFRTLINKRSDYVIDYKAPSTQALKSLSLQEIKHITLKRIKIHVLLNARLPDAKLVLKKIETAYENLEG